VAGDRPGAGADLHGLLDLLERGGLRLRLVPASAERDNRAERAERRERQVLVLDGAAEDHAAYA
jgi:hypothetical protein